MNPHDQHIIHSSEDPNWRTPPTCFQRLHKEFDFEVDAAADAASALCPIFYGPGGQRPDALDLNLGWGVHEEGDHDIVRETRIFVNPPYSKTLAAQLKKARDPRHAHYRIEHWARACWEESKRGCTIVGLFPFAPQTEWYRQYVYGHKMPDTRGGFVPAEQSWTGHAAAQERRLPHRISYLLADGTSPGNAGVNTAVIVWTPMRGVVGPWSPHQIYWSYR